MTNQFQNNNLKTFSHENEEILPKGRKRKKILKLSTYIGIFIVTGLIVFSSQVLASKDSSTSWLSKINIFSQIKNLATSGDKEIKGQAEDRINILLLGMGGQNHEGGYLADTMILASLEPSTKKVSMLSIPRDLSVPTETMGWRKINHLNAYAEAAEAGSGGLVTSQAVSEIFDIPVHYYIRVDFDGLINIVDELGGIQVDVENTLSDKQYPVMGREDAEDYLSRYEHLYIEKGLQTMDGSLALKYARSRHGSGGEGSDFARAKRQQNIIMAFKEKALKKSNLLKPTMISNIFDQLNKHISTDLEIWEILRLSDLFKETKKTDISNGVLDDSPGGFLKAFISEEGAYMLTPTSGDFSEIQYFISNIFEEQPQKMPKKATLGRATVEIRNGTWINGLASKISATLVRNNFTITKIGNSSNQNFQKSVIYDLTYGEKEGLLTLLKEKTNANISLVLPKWLINDITTEAENGENLVQPDFILILGTDLDESQQNN